MISGDPPAEGGAPTKESAPLPGDHEDTLDQDTLLKARLFEVSREAAFAWLLDEQRPILVWNQAAAQLYGYSAAEARGRNPHELLQTRAEEPIEAIEETLRHSGRWEGELRHHTRSGDERTVEVRMQLASAPGGKRVVLETGRDATERRRHEREATESTTRLRLALAGGRTGIWEWRLDTSEVFWSPEVFELLGVSPDEFEGRGEDFVSRAVPEDQGWLRERLVQAFSENGSDQDEFEAEFRVLRRDGTRRWLHSRARTERDDSGRPLRLVGILRDIDDRKRSEERLRASEHRFSSIFHKNPQPMVITRLADGTYVDVNAAFLALSGYTREEMLGRTPIDLGIWTPEQRSAFIAPFMKDKAQHDQDLPYRRDIPYRHRNGREMRLAWSAERIEVEGTPCLLNAVSDVTRQRGDEARLRHSEETARAQADELVTLLDAVPAAVWIAHDRECQMVSGNRLGYELLRRSGSSNLSMTVEPGENVHFTVWREGRELSNGELSLQQVARTGVALRDFEEELRFSNGDHICLFGSAVPLLDAGGEPRGAVAALVDITRLKQAEEALRQADRRKDEFLAILSHELRNPLAPILTAARLMALRGDVPAPAEREVIERQARHLVRLVDDLLDVSRVARGKIELRKERIELSRLMARAIETTSLLFEQQQHVLKVAVPEHGLVVEVDEVRFVQVLSNLLANAARYTPAGGTIQISAERRPDEVLIRVRDDGMGIPGEMLPHIFDLFVQGPQSHDRPRGGLGLGLALVRSLVELHGGRVEAHSEGPGKGSEFVLTLPRAGPGEERPPTRSLSGDQAAPGAGRQRILVVDDNQDAATLLAMVLEGEGHEVKVAFDPPSALALVEHFRPDLAILDIGLPVMDGYALGRELRAKLGPDRLRLVALSGYGHTGDRQRSAEAGFSNHLVKPVDIDLLLKVIAGTATA